MHGRYGMTARAVYEGAQMTDHCPSPREASTMRDKIALPLLLLVTGLFVTAVHDYAYRRVGGTDYELGGLVSHAGSDMLITTFALIITASMWLNGGFRR